MPTFHFECNKCHAGFTEQLSFGTKTLPPCPTCGATDVRKLIKPPMVHFKGSGFYKTDSRPAAASSTAKPTETKPAETKKDSPAPPTTPAPSKAPETKKP